MPGKIYLLQDDGNLQSLTEHRYDSESLLQGLLGRYPDLLAGDQINEAEPRRWLLLSREAGIPLEEDGADEFSLDHLFVDQDAIPTLVEVKRSSDLRIRREVVGQMLDYAAHAVAYWTGEGLRSRFEAACAAEGRDAGQAIAEFRQAEPDDSAAVATFWGQLKTNLQAGKIRLVFVSDEIPPELRRVVEFLNRFMDPVEVLAVEVHQFVGGKGLKTLVPRVIGQTEEARGKKAGGSALPRQWDEASFFEDLEKRRGPAEAAAARRIFEWAKERMPNIWWGRGRRWGSFIPGLDHKGIWHQAIGVWTNGYVEIQFQYMQPNPPFDREERRGELMRLLNQIPGVKLPANTINRRPSIPLAAFKEAPALDRLLQVLDWFVEQIRAT
jgi:hypothetical protein